MSNDSENFLKGIFDSFSFAAPKIGQSIFAGHIAQVKEDRKTAKAGFEAVKDLSVSQISAGDFTEGLKSASVVGVKDADFASKGEPVFGELGLDAGKKLGQIAPGLAIGGAAIAGEAIKQDPLETVRRITESTGDTKRGVEFAQARTEGEIARREDEEDRLKAVKKTFDKTPEGIKTNLDKVRAQAKKYNEDNPNSKDKAIVKQFKDGATLKFISKEGGKIKYDDRHEAQAVADKRNKLDSSSPFEHKVKPLGGGKYEVKEVEKTDPEKKVVKSQLGKRLSGLGEDLRNTVRDKVNAFKKGNLKGKLKKIHDETILNEAKKLGISLSDPSGPNIFRSDVIFYKELSDFQKNQIDRIITNVQMASDRSVYTAILIKLKGEVEAKRILSEEKGKANLKMLSKRLDFVEQFN